MNIDQNKMTGLKFNKLNSPDIQIFPTKSGVIVSPNFSVTATRLIRKPTIVRRILDNFSYKIILEISVNL